MRIQLLMLGKTRRPEMRAVLEDYLKRLRRSCPMEVLEVRDGSAALKKLNADRGSAVVLLDATGTTLDSNALAKWLGELRDLLRQRRRTRGRRSGCQLHRAASDLRGWRHSSPGRDRPGALRRA